MQELGEELEEHEHALEAASKVVLERVRRVPISDDEDNVDSEEETEGDWVDTREGADLPVSHEVCLKDHSKVSRLARWEGRS